MIYDIQAINFCIPPLTLQPIAENAVRHGIRRKEDGGTLTIRSEERGDAFIVTVTDDGAGFSPEKKNRPAEISGEEKEKKTHVGIKNVRDRLLALCKGEIEIRSIPEKGTTVTISIPKEKENELFSRR